MRKIPCLLIALLLVFGSCKKDKKSTVTSDTTEQVSTNITQKNTTTSTQSAKTVNELINLLKNKKYDAVIDGDSILVLNNKMSLQHIDNYSKKDISSQLSQIDYSKPVFDGEEPVFDGESFEKDGFFIHDKKYEIIGDWTDATPTLKDKAAKVEKNIVKVVEFIDGGSDIKIYLSQQNGTYKIVMIDLSTPGEI